MGRWSEHHDQRKGQWLINYIRFAMDMRGDREGHVLFNMTNEDFDRLMKEYYTQSEPSGMPNEERITEISARELSKIFDPVTVKTIIDTNKKVMKDG